MEVLGYLHSYNPVDDTICITSEAGNVMTFGHKGMDQAGLQQLRRQIALLMGTRISYHRDCNRLTLRALRPGDIVVHTNGVGRRYHRRTLSSLQPMPESIICRSQGQMVPEWWH